MCKITIFFVFHIIYIIKNEKKRISQPLYNVSSTKLLIVNQCVSNSPSKIRGGWGALIAQEKVL